MSLSDRLRAAADEHDLPHEVNGVVTVELETGDLLREAADRLDYLEAVAP